MTIILILASWSLGTIGVIAVMYWAVTGKSISDFMERKK